MYTYIETENAGEHDMINLLTRYRAQPTAKNAAAVRRYARNHPFATCLLTDEMRDVLLSALRHGEG